MKKIDDNKKDLSIHMGEVIKKELVNQERSVLWLANKVEFVDSSNFNKQLNSTIIKPGLLFKICLVLNRDFFAIYSRQLPKEIQGK